MSYLVCVPDDSLDPVQAAIDAEIPDSFTDIKTQGYDTKKYVTERPKGSFIAPHGYETKKYMTERPKGSLIAPSNGKNKST